MRHLTTRLFFYCVLALLASCATAPKRELPSTNNQALSHWNAEGKIGFRSSEKAESAYFVWENKAEDYQIQLFGPFGQGRVYIQKAGDTVELKRDGRTYTANSAQQLLEQTTGLSMPVHWLAYWIKGEPAPEIEASAISLNEHQQLIQFQQNEWLIQYTRYNAVNEYNLPGKMTFSKGDYSLTVIVKSWEI